MFIYISLKKIINRIYLYYLFNKETARSVNLENKASYKNTSVPFRTSCCIDLLR